MHNYRKEMVSMIKKLINGSWSVKEFEENDYLYFLDEVPDDYLSPDDIDFFGLIQEKLDFTSLNPDDESRKYGWMSYEEYIIFVRNLITETIKENNAISSLLEKNHQNSG